MTILKQIFYFGPLLFAFGFIMPLTAQIIEYGGVTLPLEISPLLAGFILASVWGAYAQYWGKWI